MSNLRASNYDHFAKYYAVSEYLTFGNRLKKCREAWVNELLGNENILLLGDGDGRFSTALLQKYPHINIVSLDANQAMLNQAQRRRKKAGISDNRLHNRCEDVRIWRPANGQYDGIFAQFFFDSFHEADLEMIIIKIRNALTTNGQLFVSDFHLPDDTKIGKLRGRLTLGILYPLFKIIADLKVQHLADYSRILFRHGFELNKETFYSQKTLVSQIFSSKPKS